MSLATSNSNPAGNLLSQLNELPNTMSGLSAVEQLYQLIFGFYAFLFETLLTTNNDNLPPPEFDPLFTSLTPASDLAFAGFGDYQFVFARAGDDVLYPFAHSLEKSRQTPLHIDLFFGDSELIKLSLLQDLLTLLGGNSPTTSGPFAPTGSDRFVLGDWRTSYYDEKGYLDFALLFDFNRQQDTVQLRGTATDYSTLEIPLFGTAIFQKKPGSPSIFEEELVGIVFQNYNLDLNASYFRYTGTTPPTGPIRPQVVQFGTAGLDIPTAITVDRWGNVYTAGFTNGDLVGENAGSYDVWVKKFDSSGTLLWDKQIGTSKADTSGFGLAVDPWGNLYIEGTTAGNLAGPLQALNTDAFLLKLDSNGNQIWGRQFGSDFLSGASNVTVDQFGNAYVSGLTVKPDPRPLTDPNRVFPVEDDFWATKYDPDGNRIWFTEVGTPLNAPALFDEAYGITLNVDGSVYTTGWTFGDFSGQGGFAIYDTQIAKFNSVTGELQKFSPNPGQLVNQFGTDKYEFAYSIDNDSQGNLYTAGWTTGDLGGPNAGKEDAWVAKTRLDGTQEWIRQFGTSEADGLFIGGLAVDTQDNIFVTGFTSGNLGGTNAGSFDFWVARYDTSGNQVWLKQYGTAEYDYATNLTVDNAGNVYVVGYTEGSLGALNQGAVDTWIAKIDGNTGNLKNFNGATQPPVNKITGTEQADRLFGTPGDDEIHGLGGDDLIVGNEGKNRLFGGNGKDTINGGTQEDYIEGGEGDDRISAGEGLNTVFGGLGNDTINGGSQADVINGDAGNDQIFAGGGTNTVSGGDGDDLIHGGAQSDLLDGGAGNDRIFASEGNNTILGGSGSDVIYSGSGNDLINGGTGNDTLWLGGGQDTVVLAIGNGLDTIQNFQRLSTKLGLSDGLTFAQLGVVQAGSSTSIRVTATGEELARLMNVQANTINASNFVAV